MPKAHKPGKSSNISLVYDKKAFTKKNEAFWQSWDPSEIKTFLELPPGLGKFKKDDPRIADWRRKVAKR